MNWTLGAVLVAAATLLPISLSADGTHDQGNEANKTDRKKVESLVAELRSPDKDPNPNREPLDAFPKDYDDKAQEKVETARKNLIAMKEAAFPVLIDHVNDKGYSRTISTSILRSLSVGEVCFMIIQEQVDVAGMPYKSRRGADGMEHVYRGYFSRYSKGAWCSQEGLKKWWAEHQNQSLKVMQIEALNWAIDRERAIGFPGEKDREYYLTPLIDQLTELKGK